MSPKQQPHTPSYRLHKPTGQAVVRIDGRDCYLGRHGTEASRARYDRLISEWLANGRRLPDPMQPGSGLTINELIVAYHRCTEGYYRKNNKPARIDTTSPEAAPKAVRF